MTISQERPMRYRREREKRKKIVKKTYNTLLLSALGTITLVVVSVTYLYIKTNNWSNSYTHQQMTNLAPEYVTDFPDPELANLTHWSNQINELLHEIERSDEKPEDVETVLEDAKDFLKSQKITRGSLFTDVERLKTYVRYYDLVANSIKKPNMDEFKAVYLSVQNLVIASNRDFDKKLVENLNHIIEKYDALINVITHEIPKYGSISGDKFTIYSGVTDLSPLINSLDLVSEFPLMQSLLDVVQKEKGNVTTNNKELQLKTNHENIMKTVNELNGLYVQRSTIKTYKDVVKNGWKVEGSYKDDDKVADLYYNRTKINDSDWIRLDAKPHIEMEKPHVELPPASNNHSNNSDTHSDFTFNFGEHTNDRDQTEGRIRQNLPGSSDHVDPSTTPTTPERPTEPNNHGQDERNSN